MDQQRKNRILEKFAAMATMGVPNGAGKPPSMPGAQYKPMPTPAPQPITPPTVGVPQPPATMSPKPRPMGY